MFWCLRSINLWCEPRGKLPSPCGHGRLYVLLLHCSSGRVIKSNHTEKTAFYFSAHADLKDYKRPEPKACSFRCFILPNEQSHLLFFRLTNNAASLNLALDRVIVQLTAFRQKLKGFHGVKCFLSTCAGPMTGRPHWAQMFRQARVYHPFSLLKRRKC